MVCAGSFSSLVPLGLRKLTAGSFDSLGNGGDSRVIAILKTKIHDRFNSDRIRGFASDSLGNLVNALLNLLVRLGHERIIRPSIEGRKVERLRLVISLFENRSIADIPHHRSDVRGHPNSKAIRHLLSTELSNGDDMILRQTSDIRINLAQERVNPDRILDALGCGLTNSLISKRIKAIHALKHRRIAGRFGFIVCLKLRREAPRGHHGVSLRGPIRLPRVSRGVNLAAVHELPERLPASHQLRLSGLDVLFLLDGRLTANERSQSLAKVHEGGADVLQTLSKLHLNRSRSRGKRLRERRGRGDLGVIEGLR